ncbi:MAG: Hsp20/alpha crystallin family protein [Polaromonas sp.]|nr:Hsp20/alpha crystallin family protein [Polaromonas sp.]
MSNLRLLDPTFSDSFESALRRFFAPVAFETEAPALTMRIDVSERNDAYVVKADIPGVKKEDINVRVDGNVIQIDAEVKREKETKGNGDKVLRSERYCGTISRTFSLAQDVEDGKAQARYADGVLTLELPKKTTAASKKVSVQ